MMPSILVAFFVNSEDSLSIFHTRLKRNVTFFSISSPYPRSVTVYPMSDSIHRKVSSLFLRGLTRPKRDKEESSADNSILR